MVGKKMVWCGYIAKYKGIDCMSNEHISNEQLLEDYKNTELEMEAYRNIGDGFTVLSTLPENGHLKFLYREKARKYANLEEQCFDFLKKLDVIMEERGI